MPLWTLFFAKPKPLKRWKNKAKFWTKNWNPTLKKKLRLIKLTPIKDQISQTTTNRWNAIVADSQAIDNSMKNAQQKVNRVTNAVDSIISAGNVAPLIVNGHVQLLKEPPNLTVSQKQKLR